MKMSSSISGKIQSVNWNRNTTTVVIDDDGVSVKLQVPSGMFLPVLEGDAIVASYSNKYITEALALVGRDKDTAVK